MFDVIIVGAGLSGLTTAYKIAQKEPSLKVQMLEADARVGGQIGLAPSGEIGGKWILAEQYHIFKLLTDLRVPMRRKTPISKELKRIWTIDKGFFAFAVNFELRRYIAELNLNARFYRPGNFVLTADEKSKTMWYHIRKKLLFKSSRDFMVNFVRIVSGADAKEICYAQFMNVIYSCGGTHSLLSMYCAGSTALIEFSSDHLLGAFMSKLEGVEIKKSTRVVEIHHQADIISIRSDSGEYFAGRVCVLAIPWNQVCDIFITPPIPATLELDCPSSKCYLTSFIAEYREAYWRRAGKSGSIYSSNPVLFTQQYRPTSLCGYLVHKSGVERGDSTLVLKKLSECFGREMNHPVSFFQQTFEQTCLLNLPERSPWNRIVWSSSSSATLFRGCMGGAVQSGLRAAIQSLLILRPQNVSWRDLAEIQKADVVFQFPTMSELFLSSLNIYNTLFYSAIGLAAFFLLSCRRCN